MSPESFGIGTPGTTEAIASNVSSFERDDVLFGRLRPYLRKVALAGFHGVCSTEILVLRANPDRILPAYLFLVLSSSQVIDYAVRCSAGSRMPRVSAHDLGRVEISLPSVESQREQAELALRFDAMLAALLAEAESASRLYEASSSQLWTSGAATPLQSYLTLALDKVELTQEQKPLAGVLNAGKGLVDRGLVSAETSDYPLEMRARVTGSVQRRKRLNPDQLLAVELPIPPLSEQAKVATRLNAMQNYERALRQEADALRRTRTALTDGLLNGQEPIRATGA